MENNPLTEQNSLALITEMINKTKHEVIKKDFNAFLFYGYAVVIVSVATWLSVRLSQDFRFMMLWFIMFLPYLASLCINRKTKRPVTTYLQGMLNDVWKIIGSMFGLTILALFGIGLWFGRIDFSLMMPLSCIYAGIGTSICGLILKEKWLTLTPLIGLFSAIYMLLDSGCNNDWNLLFGASFLLFMVIPAHIIRHKIR